MRLLFIIPNLTLGGTEKIMLFVAENFAAIDKYNVKVIVIGYQQKSFYKSSLKIEYLNKNRILSSVINILKIYITYRPNYVFSGTHRLNMINSFLSLFFKNTNAILRENNIPSVIERVYNEKMYKFLFSKLSSKAFKVIFQSDDSRKDFIKFYNIKKINYSQIPNPVLHTKKKLLNPKSNTFVAIGRLDKIKDFPKLISIISHLKNSFHLSIFGTGDEKQIILNIAKKLKVSDKIQIVKPSNQYLKIIKNYSICLQTSISEGFPNSMLDALSLGIPCIALNTPGGHNEMIINGFNGYLVSDEQEFLEKLKISLKKNWNRQQIQNDIYLRYDRKKIFKNYKNLIA